MKGIPASTPHKIERHHYFYFLLLACLLAISSPGFTKDLFVSYDQKHELIKDDTSEPLLSIYENGSVRVVYPEYMKKAGVYEWTLASQEMKALRALTDKPGIQQFDEQAVDEQIEQSNENKQTLPLYISDSTTTIIDVKDRNASGEVIEGDTNRKELVSIAFEDIPDKAEENPEIAELGELQTLQSRLEGILEQANQSNRIQ